MKSTNIFIKNLLLLIFSLHVFEVKSKELIISCMWDEKFIFDKDQNKIKSEKYLKKSFLYKYRF